eukprot:scaffold1679_cov127-Isochrysis_galbana.AAC.5
MAGACGRERAGEKVRGYSRGNITLLRSSFPPPTLLPLRRPPTHSPRVTKAPHPTRTSPPPAPSPPAAPGGTAPPPACPRAAAAAGQRTRPEHAAGWMRRDAARGARRCPPAEMHVSLAREGAVGVRGVRKSESSGTGVDVRAGVASRAEMNVWSRDGEERERGALEARDLAHTVTRSGQEASDILLFCGGRGSVLLGGGCGGVSGKTAGLRGRARVWTFRAHLAIQQCRPNTDGCDAVGFGSVVGQPERIEGARSRLEQPPRAPAPVRPRRLGLVRGALAQPVVVEPLAQRVPRQLAQQVQVDPEGGPAAVDRRSRRARAGGRPRTWGGPPRRAGHRGAPPSF